MCIGTMLGDHSVQFWAHKHMDMLKCVCRGKLCLSHLLVDLALWVLISQLAAVRIAASRPTCKTSPKKYLQASLGIALYVPGSIQYFSKDCVLQLSSWNKFAKTAITVKICKDCQWALQWSGNSLFCSCLVTSFSQSILEIKIMSIYL